MCCRIDRRTADQVTACARNYSHKMGEVLNPREISGLLKYKN